MRIEKEETKKESLRIELIIEAATNSGKTAQLQDWRKLYECLSKPVKVNDQSSKQDRVQRSGLPLKQSNRKQFYFVGNTISNNQSRFNKRLINCRVR